MWKVVIVSGSAKRNLITFDTKEEAETFAESDSWCHIDANGFEWAMEVEEDEV